MQIIDLFSGIGGFSLAALWMNWRTIQFCEIDKFCQKVLSYYWPNVPIHPDIKTLTLKEIKNNKLYDAKETTIITGGFPCQPYSVAGERKGTKDDRHLWPEMLRIIGIFHPDWIVAENVPGIINWNGGLVFEQVQTDLEKEGYEIFSFVLPACGVNAPHRRDRVWFIAHSKSNRRSQSQSVNRREEYESDNRNTIRDTYPADAICGITPNPAINAISRQNRKGFKIERGRKTVDESFDGGQQQTIQHKRLDDISQSSSNPASDGCEGGCEKAGGEIGQSEQRRMQQSERESGITPNSERGCKSGRLYERSGKGQSGGCDNSETDTNTSIKGSQGSKIIGGSGRSGTGREQQSPRFFQPDWKNFPTQSPLCGGNDGFPYKLDFDAIFTGIPFPRKPITFGKWRNESIKAMGNAIVPQVVFQIFKVIQEIENNK